MRLPSVESARKVVHLVGGLIPLLYLLLDPTKPHALLILGGLGLPFLAADVLRLWVPAVNHWFLRWFRGAMRPGEESRPTGATYYLLSCWVTILVFDRTVAVAALLVLACGDTAASVVGQALGGYRLRQRKTLSGTGAFLMTAFLVTLPFFHPAVALGGAVIGAVTECLPLPLDDNITVPLSVGICFTLLRPLAL
ncbi:MAG: diacylglycerol/polyprenol kinase family protein [Candidatus Methylomirabilales bacterium]